MPTTMQRWTLYDPVLNETWTFAMNPAEGGEPGFELAVNSLGTTAPDGDPIFFAPQPTPQDMQFNGTILALGELANFFTACRKVRAMKLTDDLGRAYWVLISKFAPSRKRVVNRPYKASYDMTAKIIRAA